MVLPGLGSDWGFREESAGRFGTEVGEGTLRRRMATTLGRKGSLGDERAGYWFVAPAAVHLVVFALLPILFVLWLSFFRWDLLQNIQRFTGFGNYQSVMADGSFWHAMGNSLVYTLVGVPLGAAVALGVAVLVAQPLKGMSFFRALYYFPAITSQVAIAMVWIYVFLPETGLINTVLQVFGLPGKTDFLNETAWAMPALIFMSVWVGLGPRMILFLAGILGISPSLYEAAKLDGAGSWRSFWSVTLPLLAPTTLFVLVTSTIGALQVFTPVYMMTQGGPVDATDTVGYHMFMTAWRDFQVGKASAQSFFLLVLTAAVSYGQYRLMRRQLEGASGGS